MGLIPKLADQMAFPSAGQLGVTVRQYVAVQIMAGFAACDGDSLPGNGDIVDIRETAQVAIAWTDALIAELEK